MPFETVCTLLTSRLPIARMLFNEVDFSINDMDNYCHSEAVYGTLNKEVTTKLLGRYRREGVTVTSAVSNTLLSKAASLVPVKDGQDLIMIITLSADTGRRCVLPVPNHDLSYHVSGIEPYSLPVSAAPNTLESLWQLTQTYSQHTNACVNAGPIFGCGMISTKACEKLMGPTNMTYASTYATSSWGVLPFVEQYGPWQLTAMIPFVNLIRWTSSFIIIQTVNDVLTLMFGGASPLISVSVLTTLRDRYMDMLQQMIDN